MEEFVSEKIEVREVIDSSTSHLGVPTSHEIKENTKCFISEALANTLEKWHRRYGHPDFMNSIHEEIVAHTFH